MAYNDPTIASGYGAYIAAVSKFCGTIDHSGVMQTMTEIKTVTGSKWPRSSIMLPCSIIEKYSSVFWPAINLNRKFDKIRILLSMINEMYLDMFFSSLTFNTFLFTVASVTWCLWGQSKNVSGWSWEEDRWMYEGLILQGCQVSK